MSGDLQVLGVVELVLFTQIDLLAPQRRHRIDSHRSPGRQADGNQREDQEQVPPNELSDTEW